MADAVYGVRLHCSPGPSPGPNGLPSAPPQAYTGVMTLLVGVFLLPFFVWSWVRHDSDEDAAAAISIIGWLVLGAMAGGLGMWALGVSPRP